MKITWSGDAANDLIAALAQLPALDGQRALLGAIDTGVEALAKDARRPLRRKNHADPAAIRTSTIPKMPILIAYRASRAELDILRLFMLTGDAAP